MKFLENEKPFRYFFLNTYSVHTYKMYREVLIGHNIAKLHESFLFIIDLHKQYLIIYSLLLFVNIFTKYNKVYNKFIDKELC